MGQTFVYITLKTTQTWGNSSHHIRKGGYRLIQKAQDAENPSSAGEK
jgi:hypothetical protein